MPRDLFPGVERETNASRLWLVSFLFVAACGPSGGGGGGGPALKVPPSLEDDSASGKEGESLRVEVLENDGSVGEATPKIASDPSDGAVEIDGKVAVYTPDDGFAGTDTFEYTVTGRYESTPKATVEVEIMPANDAPVAKDDSAKTTENEEVSVDVLANDDDPDGDALTIASVGSPEYGGAKKADGVGVVYTPDQDFDGTDTFDYTVADEKGNKAQASVEVTVEGDDDAPVAEDDVASVVEKKTITIDVTGNDRDPEGKGLTVELAGKPRRGTAKLNGAKVEYTAPSGYNGRTAFSYTVEDQGGNVAKARVHVGIYQKLDGDPPLVKLPRQSIQPDELAVIVNKNDDYSKAVGQAYAKKRGIPSENVLRVELPADKDVVKPSNFASVLSKVESSVKARVQGYVLAWLKPYRVGCMSITSAFALGGYDGKYCNTSGRACSQTAPVDYYDSESTEPQADHDIRPAMMLAMEKEAKAKKLIDRGVSADHTFPRGKGYLVRTTDKARSKRWRNFELTAKRWNRGNALDLVYVDNADGSKSNVIENEKDLMFYFTGLTRVDKIRTNTYRPGAIADHLTSFGGRLTSFGGQMSVVEWLQAGATASYGTVVEPCNFAAKFPKVGVLLEHYYRGNTLLEAYWKSVHWPGEGVFIGEPLASPWGRSFLAYDKGTLTIRTTMLAPGETYEIVGRNTLSGPVETVKPNIGVASPQMHEIELPNATHAAYILQKTSN